nr:MAG TPA: hypothetical protein [Caudoviricetes sp.]
MKFFFQSINFIPPRLPLCFYFGILFISKQTFTIFDCFIISLSKFLL